MYRWTLKGNPSAQWQEVPFSSPELLQAKATTELQSVFMASEFLLVSMVLVSTRLMILRRAEIAGLDVSRGKRG